MRGKVRRKIQSAKKQGITPAYAGKRVISPFLAVALWDHPRLCGEKGYLSSMICDGIGSPPPMRGKAHTRGVALRLTGITPAYAGKRILYKEVFFMI